MLEIRKWAGTRAPYNEVVGARDTKVGGDPGPIQLYRRARVLSSRSAQYGIFSLQGKVKCASFVAHFTVTLSGTKKMYTSTFWNLLN